MLKLPIVESPAVQSDWWTDQTSTGVLTTTGRKIYFLDNSRVVNCDFDLVWEGDAGVGHAVYNVAGVVESGSKVRVDLAYRGLHSKYVNPPSFL